MQGKFNISVCRKEIESVYGGTNIVVIYDVEHTVDNDGSKFTNNYEVKAEIRGLNDFTPEIYFTEVVGIPEHPNEETVTAGTLIEELQSCTSGELCGDEL